MENLSPVSLLCELISIPSVSSISNRPLIEFVRSVLQPRNWHLRELPYDDASGVEKINLLATPPWQSPNDFSVDVAFVCHTDTVPYSNTWSNALHPQIEESFMHGCGACDVKGFLACLLPALTSTPAEHFASTVALVLTAEEEIGCCGAKRVLDSDLLKPRHVVVGEPTSLHPARAGKGYGLAEIRVLGREAHSAHPALGISAIYRAARLISNIEQYALSLRNALVPQSAHIFDPPHTTLNVGLIEGGTAKNVVPAECKFLLEWRPLPGEAAGTVLDAVRRIIEELRSDDPDFACEINVLREQAGFETSADSPLVRRWAEITGQCAIAVPFGTEAPLMATLSNDVVVLGPGDMRTAHSARECVPLEELQLCVSYLRDLVSHPLEAAR
jgi:acetylornithine deacetylase